MSCNSHPHPVLVLQEQEHAEEGQLLDLAVKAVEMLGRC